MHLADVVSHAGLAGYAVIAMVLFFASFLGIVFQVATHWRRSESERMSRLPLEDDAAPRTAGGER